MELERLSVQLRPRGGWEALDLGFQMARAWWRPVWGTWLAVYLPIALALHAAFHDRLLIAIAVLWWLKPLFDRFVLHVVSRAVFGDPPRIVEALAAWRDCLRPGLLAALTVFRLGPARSFMLPVWQLEKQSGRDASRRRGALGKRMHGYGIWLTVLCAHFEALLFFSLGIIVVLFVPGGAETPFDFSDLFTGDGEAWNWEWFDSVCYVVAVSIVEPVYVASGFSLYLNRRAVLEGWDIELALRRLDERLRAAHAGFAAALALAIGCALLVMPAPPAYAEPVAKDEIKEVLAAPEFQQYRETTRWKYRGEREPDEPKDRPSDFWRKLGQLLADISQALLWIVAGVAVLVALVLARRHLPQLFATRPDSYRPPDALFGLAVTPESLPDDVAAAAAALVREGRLREALSLLYRGALSALVHRHRIALAEGDTEGDCLVAARRVLPQSGASYFARLVRAWSACAYAGRLPDAAATEALVREWTPSFSAAPAAASKASDG